MDTYGSIRVLFNLSILHLPFFPFRKKSGGVVGSEDTRTKSIIGIWNI